MLSRMPITRAEKPHWGARRFPFMNSMTRFFSIKPAMRSRVCSDGLIRTPWVRGLYPPRITESAGPVRARSAHAQGRAERGAGDEGDPCDRLRWPGGVEAGGGSRAGAPGRDPAH